jgi:hypothetical protein
MTNVYAHAKKTGNNLWQMQRKALETHINICQVVVYKCIRKCAYVVILGLQGHGRLMGGGTCGGHRDVAMRVS